MPALRPEELRTLAEHLLPPAQLREFVEMREADFAINVPGIGRFRVNVSRQRSSFMVVLRVIQCAVPTPEGLRLPEFVARFAEAIYVLHAFQKQTQQTARLDLALGAKRYRERLKQRDAR